MVEIVDDTTERKLLLSMEGEQAFLDYRLHDGKLIVGHTEVPEAIGGRGLGGALVAAAIDKATAEGFTLWPWCPYARSWLKEHPEEAGAVTIDWAKPPE